MIPTRRGILRGLLCLAACAAPARAVSAQEAGVAEEIAPLLEVEDARQFASQTLEAGLHAAEPLVRRQAAIAVGRIGDLRGTALLVPLLQDQDPSVPPVAAFALGLLRDPEGVAPLVAVLQRLPAPSIETASAALAALARIGGPQAVDFLAQVLGKASSMAVPDTTGVLLRQAALDAWRLGSDAPVAQLLALLPTDDDELRWRVVFSLGRLRAPAAAEALVSALQDRHAGVRGYAARALTAQYVASTSIAPATAMQLLGRATGDEQAGVRMNALRSLGTFHSAATANQAAALLSDPSPNVQVAAATALGLAGGPVAGAQLSRIVREGKGTFALRREALLGLAGVAPDSFRAVSGSWGASKSWPERATIAEGWGIAAPGGAEVSRYLADPEGRVVAAGLRGWVLGAPGQDTALAAVARGLLAHPDVGVRTEAARALQRMPATGDVPALSSAFARSSRDSVPDAGLAALDALLALSNASAEDAAVVTREFLATSSRPERYVPRLWAERNWPAAARRWGPAFPIQTGRTRDDYREIARRFVANPASPDAHPHVFIETDQRTIIELELFGPEAPLTVVNFLSLVDRRYFDGGRWQRVIPNVAALDGDPRGDGYGGPGYTIRDEINQRPFDGFVLAMANAVPDAGGSQWFLSLSPQPQFDGEYTVFGEVVGTPGNLLRETEGDKIRLIRR